MVAVLTTESGKKLTKKNLYSNIKLKSHNFKFICYSDLSGGNQ